MTTTMAPAKPSFRHRFGFWATAYTFLAVLAFSTAPSPLYVLYAHRDHFSSLMITLIYAAYAAGVAGSLFFASHLSAHRPGAAGSRPQFVAAAASLGGLSLGALLTGLLAQFAGHPLVLPYLVLLGMLGLAGIAIALSPETRHRQHPLPAYRRQRASAPEGARPQFAAALVGVFLAYTGPAVFIGLAGTFLATAVHDTSLAMAGFCIFVVFAVGVAVLAVTGTWPARRLLAVGVTLEIIGLALVVTAAWLPVPSLTLFLVGGGVVGAAAAALFRGTLDIVVAVSPPGKLGEALAGFFLSGYVGLSIPAIAVGIALQSVTPRGTLLAFAIVVSAGILAASPLLLAGTQYIGYDTNASSSAWRDERVS